MKRLIQGGTVVDEWGEYRQDLLIENERIASREEHISADEETEIIDASGCLVMPGGIDVHTHFNIDVGLARSCDDFYSGTRAAACGGTTTIVDHMGFGPQGCSLHHQLALYHEYAAGKAVIDYSFHGVIQHIDEEILSEMASMVTQEGISSFKIYLTYQYKLDDAAILQAFAELKRVGALITVHPENDAAIRSRVEQFVREGKTAAIWHARSRPIACEAEAISRVIYLAQLAGNAPLYIVHLSNGPGLDALRCARRQGQPVWVETCPQYLLLDESSYEQPDALKFILSPPLREKAQQALLWEGICDGSIDTVATDHCTFPWSQRLLLSDGNFTRCPNGLPGVENRMALLFSTGVATGLVTPSRFVALTSSNPAKLFGLWPQKGSLQVGADADIVLFAPHKTGIIRHESLHDNVDYSPYEGMTLRGLPVMTISRGEIVWRNGLFTGRAGHGRFLHRLPFTTRDMI
ncbi:dihydropyrimidinase [Enterobacteriaceae bacterium H11S18]|uniref:dihydropyrimidinase n=1 Tax=Dryocola clanedunensis TaxID=2925396 RepID=UPI0022F0DDB3|nr:dihydropyrimidinase [Dryocola clanedunensis]MCT4713337.1 dihydropyrimidinase [Dryocola clanedunensis]